MFYFFLCSTKINDLCSSDANLNVYYSFLRLFKVIHVCFNVFRVSAAHDTRLIDFLRACETNLFFCFFLLQDEVSQSLQVSAPQRHLETIPRKQFAISVLNFPYITSMQPKSATLIADFNSCVYYYYSRCYCFFLVLTIIVIIPRVIAPIKDNQCARLFFTFQRIKRINIFLGIF